MTIVRTRGCSGTASRQVYAARVPGDVLISQWMPPICRSWRHNRRDRAKPLCAAAIALPGAPWGSVRQPRVCG
jgi:hypothetical protein